MRLIKTILVFFGLIYWVVLSISIVNMGLLWEVGKTDYSVFDNSIIVIILSTFFFIPTSILYLIFPDKFCHLKNIILWGFVVYLIPQLYMIIKFKLYSFELFNNTQIEKWSVWFDITPDWSTILVSYLGYLSFISFNLLLIFFSIYFVVKQRDL